MFYNFQNLLNKYDTEVRIELTAEATEFVESHLFLSCTPTVFAYKTKFKLRH